MHSHQSNQETVHNTDNAANLKARAMDAVKVAGLKASAMDAVTKASAAATSEGQVTTEATKAPSEKARKSEDSGVSKTAVKMSQLVAKLQHRDPKEWNELPVLAYRDRIVESVQNNQVVIVTGDTGSGKTTQIPQYLLASGIFKRPIAVTQPRRVAAVSVAKRVAEEVGATIGEEIGYVIRFEDVSTTDTVVKYMTDGVLLRQCLSNPTLDNYSVVILDEAHERSLNTDILIALLKQLCKRKPQFRLVVTSATLDAEKFSKYFFGAPIIQVPGRQFPVDVLWREPTIGKGYMTMMADIVERIHVEEPANKGILVFLTGQEEIERFCKNVSERISTRVKNGQTVSGLQICPLHASLPPEFYERVFSDPPEHTRKLVVSTNVAETSVTVSGITFVVDSGLVKQKQHNEKTGMDSLQIVQISKQAAAQRTGRAGRLGPGICYRVYSKSKFQVDFPDETLPEILRTSLAQTVLTLKGMGVHDTMRFDYMDAPRQGALVVALKKLYFLGAVDSSGRITNVGRQLLKFPLEPALGKMLLEAADFGVVDDMLTVVAMMSTDSLFYKPTLENERALADQKRILFMDGMGDAASMLNVWREYQSSRNKAQWCKDSFVQIRAMRKAVELRQQIEKVFDQGRIQVKSRAEDRMICLHKAIGRSLYMHAARRGLRDSYCLLSDGRMVTLAGSSMLIPSEHDEWPDCIVGYELVWSGGGQLRFVCAVRVTWVEPLLPRLREVNIQKLCGPSLISSGPTTNQGLDTGSVMTEESSEANKRQGADDAKQRYLERKRQRMEAAAVGNKKRR